MLGWRWQPVRLRYARAGAVPPQRYIIFNSRRKKEKEE
jgi:hypothetical protein